MVYHWPRPLFFQYISSALVLLICHYPIETTSSSQSQLNNLKRITLSAPTGATLLCHSFPLSLCELRKRKGGFSSSPVVRRIRRLLLYRPVLFLNQAFSDIFAYNRTKSTKGRYASSTKATRRKPWTKTVLDWTLQDSHHAAL